MYSPWPTWEATHSMPLPWKGSSHDRFGFLSTVRILSASESPCEGGYAGSMVVSDVMPPGSAISTSAERQHGESSLAQGILATRKPRQPFPSVGSKPLSSRSEDCKSSELPLT